MGRRVIQGEDFRPKGLGDVHLHGPVQLCAPDQHALRVLVVAGVGVPVHLLSELMTPIVLRLGLDQTDLLDGGIVPSVPVGRHGPGPRGVGQGESGDLLRDWPCVHRAWSDPGRRVRCVVSGSRAGLDQIVELGES